jgi:hypothetical protein
MHFVQGFHTSNSTMSCCLLALLAGLLLKRKVTFFAAFSIADLPSGRFFAGGHLLEDLAWKQEPRQDLRASWDYRFSLLQASQDFNFLVLHLH